MKKLILLTALCFPVVGFAQTGFSIKGTIGKLNAPAKAYLTYREGKNLITDSAALVNGNFNFKGTVQSPLSASIRLKHNNVPPNPDPKLRTPNDVLSLFLENKNMTLSAADSIKKAVIKGSPINDDNARLRDQLKPLTDQMNLLMAEYKTYTKEQMKDTVFMKPFMVKYDSINEQMEIINKAFASENKNSYIGLLAYRGVMGYDIDLAVVEPEFLSYSAEVRNTPLGKSIADMIEGVRKTQIGLVTDFTQNDKDGNPVKLSDFRGKYVLVDFWASWCGPCRQENPNVVAEFNKYKDKNFTVLGVSLDNPGQKEAWLKAIEDDGLNWPQVSDLKGWENAVSSYYGIQAIPFNFLVDPSGKIIARNITGESLQKKLAELIGANAGK